MEPTRADAPRTTAVQPNGNDLGQNSGQMGASETAKQGAAEAVSAVKQEVRAATGDAKAQARSLLDQSRTQLRGEASVQTDKLSGSLRQVGTQLQALADGRTEEAGPVGDYARQAADAVARYADNLQSKGFEGVLRDTQDFARRRPGTFLLGAAIAGVVAGRFIRNARGGDTSTTSYASQPYGYTVPPAYGYSSLAEPSGAIPLAGEPGDWGTSVDVGGAAL